MSFFRKLFKLNKKSTSATPTTSDLDITYEFSNVCSDPTIPPFQGDYAKTLFLNSYQKDHYLRKKENYQRYLLYTCGIKDSLAYHKQLIKEGYFQKAPLENRLRKLKVAELKDILKSLNQQVSGKKDTLIQRIMENSTEQDLLSFFPEQLYSITEKGKDFLNSHYHYVQIYSHSNWDIDWKEYDKLSKPGYSFYDVVWGIFNKRILSSKNYCRSEYLHMYELLSEENRALDALDKLLRVLYIDLSGVLGVETYKLYKQRYYSKQDMLDSFDIHIMFAPGIIASFEEYKLIDMTPMIDDIYKDFKLPVQICDKQLFSKIISSIINDTFYKKEKVFEKALKKNYQKYINTL